jgi:hypothetical protein
VDAYARPGGEERLQLIEGHGAAVREPTATGQDPVEILHEDLQDSVRFLRQVFPAGSPRGLFARFQLDQRNSARVRFPVHPRLDEIRYPEIVHFHTYPGVEVVGRDGAGEVEVGLVLFGPADVEKVCYGHCRLPINREEFQVSGLGFRVLNPKKPDFQSLNPKLETIVAP